MLLTLTNNQPPATDLGYLLHKNPARVNTTELGFGKAVVFYPVAREDRCTAALFLDIDPVDLVRGRTSGETGLMDQYVNDRPYVASSFLSVAIARTFGTALGGRSKERPELVTERLPIEATIAVLRADAGESFIRALFEPLGYQVGIDALPLDAGFPEWKSQHFRVQLSGQVTVHDLLSHLYVLLPTLDEEKHYYLGQDEVDKLLRHGEGWLANHPARDRIVRKYLRGFSSLTDVAFARLVEEDGDIVPASVKELETKRAVPLNSQRLAAVAEELRRSGAKRILDLGCGAGRLLQLLIKDSQFDYLLGVDVSHRALSKAKDALDLDRMPARLRERIELIQGSLVYRDRRLEGFDAAAVVEVIEHLDQARLAAFERVLFEFARPRVVVVTTPNREYNAIYSKLSPSEFRHDDHRFEWTRDQFSTWTTQVCERFRYQVSTHPVGSEDAAYGAPTQMAVFTAQES